MPPTSSKTWSTEGDRPRAARALDNAFRFDRRLAVGTRQPTAAFRVEPASAPELASAMPETERGELRDGALACASLQ